MNITLSSPLTGLAGIGDTRAARFARLGIHTVGELLLSSRGDTKTEEISPR